MGKRPAKIIPKSAEQTKKSRKIAPLSNHSPCILKLPNKNFPEIPHVNGKYPIVPLGTFTCHERREDALFYKSGCKRVAGNC